MTASLAERLKLVRKHRQLTQEEVAWGARLSLNTYTALERGVATDPHISTLKVIAQELDCSVAYLIGEE